MFAEWSAECGAEDPVLVVPWSAEGLAHSASMLPRFVDLREDPYDLDQIPEAAQHPALMESLRSLNAGRSPVFTAKCDAWVMDADELAGLQQTLDLVPDHPAEAPDGQAPPPEVVGFASYLDLVWRERSLFVSAHVQGQRLDRLMRLLEPLVAPLAVTECVLRPALVDLAGPQEGFSITLYVKALGPDAKGAYDSWAAALRGVVAVLRSREFTFS